MVANAAYVQGFASVKTMLEDIDRTRRSLVSFKELNNSDDWLLLEAFVKSNQLFSDDTKSTITKISDALKSQGDQASVGLTTVGLGTLRGSLQAMAGAILEGEFGEAKNIAKNVGRSTLGGFAREVLQNENLQQSVIAFITTYQNEMIWLSKKLPIYFSWLKSLVDLTKVLQ